MRVLIACEFSGTVRDAFRSRGHLAYSCDLRMGWGNADARGLHFRRDVTPLLGMEWDLVIAHPPCTYLTNSGVQYLKRPGRRDSMIEATELFLKCLAANAPRVCVENPLMCGAAMNIVGRPTQTIQPYQFGHREKKSTCLWLKGLPKLEPTEFVPPPYDDTLRCLPPSPERGLLRSVTFSGIAEAMADQWGTL